MDFEKLADKFIEEGGWQGSPRIAIELFAKWLEEHNASQQSVQRTTDGACENCGNNCWKLVCETCGAE